MRPPRPAEGANPDAARRFDTHRRFCYNYAPRGAVAQLGERLNGIQEVDGSIPFGSTIYQTKNLERYRAVHQRPPEVVFDTRMTPWPLDRPCNAVFR